MSANPRLEHVDAAFQEKWRRETLPYQSTQFELLPDEPRSRWRENGRIWLYSEPCFLEEPVENDLWIVVDMHALDLERSMGEYRPFSTSPVSVRLVDYNLFGSYGHVTQHAPPAEDSGHITAKEMVEAIQEHLSFSVSDIARSLGVSRQTLYNWIDGSAPAESHLAKLKMLHEAAQRFQSAGVSLGKPRRSLLVDHCVEKGFDDSEWESYIERLLQHTLDA